MATLTPSALQRLQRDIREMEKEPLPGIEVKIDANNVSCMCLLLAPLEGPYTGIRLHLSVHIPPTYPHAPPEVSIQTSIDHPNVFGSFICCDLLKSNTLRSADYYNGGYTPAYLLKYLFMQLLSFFSAPQIEQDYGGHANLCHYASPPSFRFSCKKCGFDSGSSWHTAVKERKKAGECGRSSHATAAMVEKTNGEIKSIVIRSFPELQQAPAEEGEDHLHALNEDVWLVIFDQLSDQDLVSLGRASPSRAGAVLRRYNVSLRRELLCFFTRKTFKEAVLGVGVRLESPTTNNRRGSLLAEAFDLLSLEAFEKQHVRVGICGHKFTHFLPLALDDEHFARALPALRNSLIGLNITSDTSPTGFLDVIPKLMNTMIVNMMKLCDAHAGMTLDAKRAILQASEKAFKGYCLLFHLLIKLAATASDLKAKARKKLSLFLSSKEARNKQNIPDLGEFLALLPLALEDGYEWPSLCASIVEELLTRNVLWVLRQRPELAELRSHDQMSTLSRPSYVIPTQRRLEETFNASRTGLRLTMLQAKFMRALVKCRSRLSQSYGFPPASMGTQLVELVKRIYVVGEGREAYQKGYGAWRDFFTLLQYHPVPSERETEEMLRKAIQDSESKGYHGPSKIRARNNYISRPGINSYTANSTQGPYRRQ